jgi:hypothetical protein
MKIRSYSELIKIKKFIDRFEYLKIGGKVGIETFGYDRYLNQLFYTSREWRRLRDDIILRDNGCDMSTEGYEIFGRIYIHHLNPISKEDILNRTPRLIDPEFLVCTSYNTHNAIHYSDKSLLPETPIERKPYDTCPWKGGRKYEKRRSI